MDVKLERRALEILTCLLEAEPSGWPALLDKECLGDAAVRRRVEELLASHRAGKGMLSTQPTPGGPRADEAPTEPVRPGEGIGTRIGAYKLLELIGEGGFGSVFLAEQEHPVRRRVALKIIKLGMDTRQVIARFEAERQALAIMDHPNIARVFDAGATESGRPYFVMELVRGIPITEYCDKNSLDVPERLALFQQVCQAVQHAHQKGVIHRDIKPNNVLVTSMDSQGVPKVIDFGIAKATSARLTEKTLFTEHRALIGTPEYMSPEQADLTASDIDTRSDVYSLGVLLYELLTGALPFDSKRLRSAAYAEIQRIIREEEPPKPSTRLSTLEALPSVAARRRVEPGRLERMVRGDLDWIAMKCLEKDRTRRYETASALAADVARHLAGEPVVAAPPSTGYRVRKFVRRNKGPVAAGAAIAMSLLIGVVAFAWQASVAAGQRDRAVTAEGQTKKRADELQLVSDFQAQMLSQVNPTEAGELLTQDVTAKFSEALVKADVPEGERAGQVESFVGQWNRINATDAAIELIDRTILKPAIDTIDKQFKDQPAVDAQLRQALADRYRELGLYDASLPLQITALAIRRRVLGDEDRHTLQSITNMGLLLREQGKYSEAEPYYLESLEKSRRVLGKGDVDMIVIINNMGGLLRDQGKYDEALVYWREALEKSRRVLGEEHSQTLTSINNMGCLLKDQGKHAEAEPYFREALEKLRRLVGEDHANTIVAINNLGVVLQAQGKYADAEPYYLAALEKSRRALGENHPQTLTAINNMGYLLQSRGKYVQAEPYYREALEKFRLLLGDDNPNTLIAIGNMGAVLRLQEKFAESVELLAPAEAAVRRVFTGANARTLAALLADLGLARARLPFDADRFTLAQANLIEAYTIRATTHGEKHKRTLDCAQALADLYEVWDKADSGHGYDTKAAEWKTKLEAVR